MIINALSADWGFYREADGKVVWVSISPTHKPAIS
jgi:hypothetical protein